MTTQEARTSIGIQEIIHISFPPKKKHYTNKESWSFNIKIQAA